MELLPARCALALPSAPQHPVSLPPPPLLFFKLGEGRGTRLPLISVEEKSLFCSGFWLTQQTVFKI